VNLAPSKRPAAAGRRLFHSHRRLQQITASQAEAEAVIAQSVENLYALGGVAPGATARYEWFVPDTAGPASKDGPVVVYAYVSGVDHIKHINAGEHVNGWPQGVLCNGDHRHDSALLSGTTAACRLLECAVPGAAERGILQQCNRCLKYPGVLVKNLLITYVAVIPTNLQVWLALWPSIPRAS
jgi:hypothetical protein